MATVVTGLFSKPEEASHAVHMLESRGVPTDLVSMVAREDVEREHFEVDSHSKMSEGVAVGATSGAAVGALVAGLTSVGVIATGGLGLVAVGPVIAALAGAGAGAAGGGVLGGLIGFAIPEHELKHYEEAVKGGGVVVAVECRSDALREDVEEVFKECNADKISSV